MLESVTAPLVFELAGLGISAVVFFTVLGSCIGQLLQIRHSHRQGQLELEQFHVRLDEARAEVQRKKEQASRLWEGYRKFIVADKVHEDAEQQIASVYLAPHDDRPLPEFQPGQFLTFKLDVPGQKKPVVRCYSLSSAPDEQRYRCSIKHLPGGVASGHFHETVQKGDILDVKAPSGNFFLDLTRDWPVVLIGGGIGVTPMLSMYESLVRKQPRRRVWFFYGARSSRELVKHDRLVELTRDSPNRHVWFCLSRPTTEDQTLCKRSAAEFADLRSQGDDSSPSIAYINRRIDVRWIRKVLGGQAVRDTHHFYICGPGPLLKSTVEDLQEWGVPDFHVHYEAFGPSSLTPQKKQEQPAGQTFNVTFGKSSKTVEWDPDANNLLDFAEANDVAVDFGCRAGDCGSCKVAIKSGEVSYVKEPPSKPERGTALLCVASPASDLTIDA